MLFEIAKRHGLELDEVPEYGGQAYLEKQDYILKKQNERIAEQKERTAGTKYSIRRIAGRLP